MLGVPGTSEAACPALDLRPWSRLPLKLGYQMCSPFLGSQITDFFKYTVIDTGTYLFSQLSVLFLPFSSIKSFQFKVGAETSPNVRPVRLQHNTPAPPHGSKTHLILSCLGQDTAAGRRRLRADHHLQPLDLLLTLLQIVPAQYRSTLSSRLWKLFVWSRAVEVDPDPRIQEKNWRKKNWKNARKLVPYS